MTRAWLLLAVAACGSPASSAPPPPSPAPVPIVVETTNVSDAGLVAVEPAPADAPAPRPAGLESDPPHPHPRGPVSVVEVEAPPTMADVQRVVMGLRPRLRACHQRGLNEEPFMSGRVVLKMTVNAKGDVTAAKAERTGTVSPAVGACMEAVAKRAVFGSGPFQLSVPITCATKATGP